MFKNKKIKFILLPTTVLSTSLAITTMSYKKDNSNIDKKTFENILSDLKYNSEYVSKVGYKKDEFIFEKLKNNKCVNDLIYSLSFNLDKNELIDELYKLKLNEEEIQFLIYKISSFLSSTKNDSQKTATITYIQKQNVFKSKNLMNDVEIIDENFNDHGLNDWDFQMKNNEETMYKIAFNFSDNFKKGIVWKVTDWWFSYPELYIAPTNEYIEDSIKEPSPSSFKHLSPGTNFNFGNKIKEISK